MKSNLAKLFPGVILCVIVTLLAIVIQKIEERFLGYPYVEALVVAILIGTVIRTVWNPTDLWLPGINFSAKFLLEVAVTLLGASVSIATVYAVGPALFIGIIGIVAVAVIGSYFICRSLGLSTRMAILVACGNSICGNSAIVAVAPVIGANGKDVASSIAFTAVLGVLVVIGLPLLVPILKMSETQYGILAGLTVYAVPQVLAATLPVGALSNQIGTLVKLVRVLMLGPVVLILSVFARRLRAETISAGLSGGNQPVAGKLAIHQIVPWFIIAFLIMAALRSLSILPENAAHSLLILANALTTVSMAALGLGVDIRVVAQAGIRVTASVTLSLLGLGIASFILIHALGIL
jgi:uncharacterized integral membrane protein (TIGR00698 family)